MFSRSWVAVIICVCAVAAAHAADEEKKLRPYDGSHGYALFAGTTSPDGAWALAFGTVEQTAEELGKLKEWPADLGIDGEKMSFDNFLVDLKQKRVVASLPEGFDYFNGHGWHKNRGTIYVAWTPDSHHALAICEERWDDSGIVWLDPVARKFPSVKEPMEKAYAAWLKAHEKKKPRIGEMQFSSPVALGPDVVVVDAISQIPKEEADTYEYRLKIRFTPAGKGKDGAVRCEILAGHKEPEQSEPEQINDVAVMEKYLKKLRAKLPPKDRAALDKEQDQWVAWSDKEPADAQSELISQRTALLRARLEFP